MSEAVNPRAFLSVSSAPDFRSNSGRVLDFIEYAICRAVSPEIKMGIPANKFETYMFQEKENKEKRRLAL